MLISAEKKSASREIRQPAVPKEHNHVHMDLINNLVRHEVAIKSDGILGQIYFTLNERCSGASFDVSIVCSKMISASESYLHIPLYFSLIDFLE